MAWQLAQLASAIDRPSSIIAGLAGTEALLTSMWSMQAVRSVAGITAAIRNCRRPMVTFNPVLVLKARRQAAMGFLRP
jgi:hypothetical protein